VVSPSVLSQRGTARGGQKAASPFLRRVWRPAAGASKSSGLAMSACPGQAMRDANLADMVGLDVWAGLRSEHDEAPLLYDAAVQNHG
jgi:hypothetical protein